MSERIPSRLVFAVRSKYKGKTYLFIAVLVFLQLCLTWPIYPFFAVAQPFILGLPLPIAWAILIVTLAFLAVLSFYLMEMKSTKEDKS